MQHFLGAEKMIRKVWKQLNITKTVITLILVNFIQVIILISIIVYSYSIFNKTNINFSGNMVLIFYILVAVVIFNGITSIKDIYLLTSINIKYQMQKKTIFEIETLNKTLRGQRHDFLNHLQVVHSLIEMDEYIEASDYIKKVYKDINRVSRILRTSNVAVNALLQAKLQECENRGIMVVLKISSPLESLIIPSWEMCRVLSNLIDNAIDAVQNKTDKLIQIEIYEDIMGYVFKVIDNGDMIPDKMIDKIFDVGFTTKNKNGEGMGLAIVKEIVNNYSGSVKVNSCNEKTIFIVKIPF